VAAMAGALAAGYHGPPELTLARAFTQWTLDWQMLVLAVALGACYTAGIVLVRRRGKQWPRVRGVLFIGCGLGMLVIATMSWVGVYQGVLFYARSAQVVLLILVVPLFLALGRPITLAIAVFPRAGPRIEAVIRGRAARVLTFPAITTLALVVIPFVMYFTSWYACAVPKLAHSR
jgi:cytochrome c oxidase assembly factor CtaG